MRIKTEWWDQDNIFTTFILSERNHIISMWLILGISYLTEGYVLYIIPAAFTLFHILKSVSLSKWYKQQTNNQKQKTKKNVKSIAKPS